MVSWYGKRKKNVFGSFVFTVCVSNNKSKMAMVYKLNSTYPLDTGVVLLLLVSFYLIHRCQAWNCCPFLFLLKVCIFGKFWIFLDYIAFYNKTFIQSSNGKQCWLANKVASKSREADRSRTCDIQHAGREKPLWLSCKFEPWCDKNC